MKILVTGGSGFIGSHLVDKLLENGNRVVVLDNLDSGKTENLKQHQGKPNFKFIRGDMTKKEDVKKAMEDVEVVYHLAAMVGVKHYVAHPKKVILVNVKGTENLLEASEGVKKFLFTSTSEVYGRNTEIPLKEDSDRVLGDTSVDRWCYSTSKSLDEHLCFAYYRENGIPISIVRYFNVYGPRADSSDYSGVIPIFIRRILNGKPPQVHGDGKQTRCFTYVKDIVEGTILAAEKSKGEVFNLGTEKEINILELANTVLKLMNSELKPGFIPYKEFYGEYYEDIRRRVPDCSKARKILGWKPRISMEEGLKLTIEAAKLAKKASG